jgi:Pyridoxal phosphate biosynthesis protein
MCGEASFQAVKKAIELAMAKEVDATVTGPLIKSQLMKPVIILQDIQRSMHILPVRKNMQCCWWKIISMSFM